MLKLRESVREAAVIWCLHASPDRIRKCRRFWTCCDSSVWWWYRRSRSTPSFTESSFSSWRTRDWSESSAGLNSPIWSAHPDRSQYYWRSGSWAGASMKDSARQTPFHQYYTQILLWALTRDCTWPGTFIWMYIAKRTPAADLMSYLNTERHLFFSSGVLLQWNDFMKDWKHACDIEGSGESHKYPVR